MPTPSGLPKVNEIWTRKFKLPPDWKENIVIFRVLQRGPGSYWSLRVEIICSNNDEMNAQLRVNPSARRQLWVDPAHWFSQGELEYTPLDTAHLAKLRLLSEAATAPAPAPASSEPWRPRDAHIIASSLSQQIDELTLIIRRLTDVAGFEPYANSAEVAVNIRNVSRQLAHVAEWAGDQ